MYEEAAPPRAVAHQVAEIAAEPARRSAAPWPTGWPRWPARGTAQLKCWETSTVAGIPPSPTSIARTLASALQGDSTAQKNLKELGPLLEDLLGFITNVNDLTKEEKTFILELLNTATPWA